MLFLVFSRDKKTQKNLKTCTILRVEYNEDIKECGGQLPNVL